MTPPTRCGDCPGGFVRPSRRGDPCGRPLSPPPVARWAAARAAPTRLGFAGCDSSRQYLLPTPPRKPWRGRLGLSNRKNPHLVRGGDHSVSGEKNYFFRDSSTATATETVMPTMGLLPAPRKPFCFEQMLCCSFDNLILSVRFNIFGSTYPCTSLCVISGNLCILCCLTGMSFNFLEMLQLLLILSQKFAVL